MKSIKQFFAYGALLVLVSSCGKAFDTSSGAGSNTPPPLDPSQLQIKGASGYFPVAKSDLIDLKVTIFPCAETQNKPFPEQWISQSKAIPLLQFIAFNAPVEQANPNLVPTGQIVIEYNDHGVPGSRTMNILGTQLVQDSLYKEVFYASSKPLDLHWLGF